MNHDTTVEQAVKLAKDRVEHCLTEHRQLCNVTWGMHGLNVCFLARAVVELSKRADITQRDLDHREKEYRLLSDESEKLEAERDRLKARCEELKKSLTDVLNLIEDGLLVRGTKGDFEQGWQMKWIEPMRKLAEARAALEKKA